MRALRTALLALLLPVGAAAQASFLLHGGPSVPVGDVANGWRMGYNVGGGLSLPVSESWSVRLEAAYDRFGVDASGRYRDFTGDTPERASVIEGAGYSALTALAGLELRLATLAGGTTPYLTGGLGFALLTYEEGALLVDGDPVEVVENRDGGLAASVGAGVHVSMMESLGVFAEGRVTAGWPLDDRVDLFLPLRLGVSFIP